jgi:hypothetical protein
MTTTADMYREGGFRMSWGAVFGGTVVTLGLWLLLHTLGLAAGLSAIDPEDQGSLRGIGIGTGVWSVIAPLIALFVGGFVAAQSAGYFDRTIRLIHGVVVWGLTALLGAVLVSMALAATVRAGVRTGAAALSAGAAAATAAGASLESLGMDADDLLGPINQRRASQGARPVTAAQLEAAARTALQQGLRAGRLDRAVLTRSIQPADRHEPGRGRAARHPSRAAVERAVGPAPAGRADRGGPHGEGALGGFPGPAPGPHLRGRGRAGRRRSEGAGSPR